MAEDQGQSIADAAMGGEGKEKKMSGKKLFVMMLAVVVLIGAGAGVLAGWTGGSEDEPSLAEQQKADESADLEYIQLESVTTNLRDPRLTRYSTVEVWLGVAVDDVAEVQAKIDENLPELRNWMIVYLSDRTVEEVNGGNVKRRVLRDIKDRFNEMLWPDSKPLIRHAILNRWHVR